ncbi:plant synaptotagmin, partial [Trifolium pratense]
RLIFKPLVNDFPAFGAVLFSLREKKALDFTLKVIGGDISALPGVSEAIEETIRDAIEDSITWPVRKIIPIIPGDYSNLELKPVGTLDVKLVQAKNLTNKDLIGKSDPFAVVFVRPLRDRTKTSKTINNQLNPIWNEHFEFIIEDASTQHLTIRIFDDEGIQAAELIGCAQVSLKELEPGKVKVVWLKLVKDLEVHRDNKYRGEVHLELLYCPYGVEHTLKSPFHTDYSLTTFEKTLKSDTEDDDISAASSRRKSNVIVRGVLSVTVISAEDLPVVDLMGKADPFVVLSLKKSEKKQKTRVVNESLNPVWNQTFDFVVEDGLHDMLIVELWDHDTFGKVVNESLNPVWNQTFDFVVEDGLHDMLIVELWDHDTFGKEKMGKVIMTLTKVILEGEYDETFDLDDAKSGKINLHLRWAAQHKYRDP